MWASSELSFPNFLGEAFMITQIKSKKKKKSYI